MPSITHIDSKKNINILRIRGNATESVADTVAVEEPLEVLVRYGNIKAEVLPLTSMMRTPGEDTNLVTGWLITMANLHPEEIIDIRHSGTEALKTGQSNRVIVTLSENARSKVGKTQRSEIANASCGMCGLKQIEHLLSEGALSASSVKHSHAFSPSRWKLDAQQILNLATELKHHQKLFADTGGTHGVGLFDTKGKMLEVQEDVGRHNALDKLIGANYQKLFNASTPFGTILSGRVSFEMVFKAVKAGISIIIAIGAPSSLAVELAKEADVALFGFVSDSKINRYV